MRNFRISPLSIFTSHGWKVNYFSRYIFRNDCMPSTSASSPTDKILSRIRAGLSLGLMDAENFQTLMDSNSGDVDELKRVALSLARAIDLVEDQSKALDLNDPSLIIPREIVSALASQASTGDAIIAEWLDSRKATAVQRV
jgi:hypothetical protein